MATKKKTALEPKVWTTDDRVAVMAQECHNQRGSLMNSIICRKQHPSYGYTKARILAELAQLEGMLYAYHLATDGEPVVYLPRGARQAADSLGIDLNNLRERAEKA